DPEQRPVERLRAERSFEREDLHADELADDRVGDEESGENQEQSIGARIDGADSGTLAHGSLPRRRRNSRRPCLSGLSMLRGMSAEAMREFSTCFSRAARAASVSA